jgi:hypothetical protein
VWCSVLCFELVLTCGVYLILYITIIILLYIILYIISYTILFFCSISLPLLLFLFYSIPPPSYSFYTCRYLHTLIYISLSIIPFFPLFKNNLTPHVLSEWMVEVCGAYLCGVLGSGVMCFMF